MDKPLVLVTGASGYVSAHVIKLLQEEGYQVRGTVRSTKNEDKIKHLYTLCPGARHKLELVEADLLKEDGWDRAVKGCTYVLHIASPFVAEDPKDEMELIRPAVEGTLVVLKACAKAGTVKRVVLTSSVAAVTNKGGGGKFATEDDWADINFPDMPTYNKSKTLAEKAAWDFNKELPENQRFELAVVNPAFVQGPVLHGTPGASTSVMQRLLNRKTPLVPALSLNIVDVRDVALAHLRCMTLPEAAGHRHIVSAKDMWVSDMARILHGEFHQYGYNVPLLPMPDFLFWFATLFDKSYRSARNTASEPMLFDNSRMRLVLGIEPMEMEKTLIDMGHSLIEHGFVKKTDKYRPRI